MYQVLYQYVLSQTLYIDCCFLKVQPWHVKSTLEVSALFHTKQHLA